MNNPFEGYTPPSLDEIFSTNGKAQILDFKLTRFQERAKCALLEEGALNSFLAGDPIQLEYNSPDLNRLITFTDEDGEIELIAYHATQGIAKALKSIGENAEGQFLVSFVPDEEEREITVAVQKHTGASNC